MVGFQCHGTTKVYNSAPLSLLEIKVIHLTHFIKGLSLRQGLEEGSQRSLKKPLIAVFIKLFKGLPPVRVSPHSWRIRVRVSPSRRLVVVPRLSHCPRPLPSAFPRHGHGHGHGTARRGHGYWSSCRYTRCSVVPPSLRFPLPS